MKTFIALLVSTFIFLGFSLSATCVSLGNGDWNTPSTWSCGVVPAGGDTVTIQAGDTVTISGVTNAVGAPMIINVDGILMFDSPGAKLRLPCGSIIDISATGSIQSSGVGQASHSIRICGGIVWTGSDGSLFGPLVLGVILPIELTYFDAETQSADINFSWQTATELNNDYFNIEGSTDGFNWNSVTRITGAGTTDEVQNYSFVSPNNDNFSYFRLKQTDFDGQFSYSDIVAVTLNHEALKVYPNPSSGRELNINLPSKESGTLQVLRTDGRIAYSLEFNSSQELHLNDLNLTPGSYIIQVQQSDQVHGERLIVR